MRHAETSFKVFLSYASRDRELADDLARVLTERGYGVFLDERIIGGETWERRIFDEVRQCSVMLPLWTENAATSRWVFAELVLARYLGVPLIPILRGHADLPSVLGTTQYVRVEGPVGQLRCGALYEALDRLDGRSDWDVAECPFPGLTPMDEGHAAVFFGREDAVREALNLLQVGLRRGANLLTIVGRSGSGKSSLMRAGLLPRLKKGAIAGSEKWTYLRPFRPEREPLTLLAELVNPHLPQATDQLRDRLEADARKPNGFLSILREVRGEGTKILLAVDQMEDLVRSPQPEAVAFLQGVMRALKVEDSPIVLISAVRAGDVHRLTKWTEQADHADLFVASQLYMKPMSDRGLHEAIEGPARVGRIHLQDGLVDAIVRDAIGEDTLPLLSHTLKLMWERAAREGTRHMITLEDYRRTEGVMGALEQEADRVFAELSGNEQDALLDALAGLADVDAEGAITSRPVPRSSMPADARRAIDRFVNRFLLTEVRNPLKPDDPMIRASHDALLRRWGKLRERIKRPRLDALWWLRSRHGRWIQADRANALLVPWVRLPRAWQLKRSGYLDERQWAYVRQSVLHHTTRLALTVVVLLTLGGTFQLLQSSLAERRNVEILMGQNLELVQERIQGLFDEAEEDIRIAAAQVESWGPLVELDRSELTEAAEEAMVARLNAHFHPILAHREPLSSLMVANDSGFEYLALKVPDGSDFDFYNRVVRERGAGPSEDAPPPLSGGCVVGDDRAPAFEARFALGQGGRAPPTVPWSQTVGEARILTAGDLTSFRGPWEGYDVVCRGWYVPAEMSSPIDSLQVVWSEPLIFFVTRDPGVTAAVRVPLGDEELVLAFDYQLTDLSMITTDFELGSNSGVLVLSTAQSEQEPAVVALPHFPELDNLPPDGKREAIREVFRVDREDTPDTRAELPTLQWLEERALLNPVVREGILEAVGGPRPMRCVDPASQDFEVHQYRDYWIGMQMSCGATHRGLADNRRGGLALNIVVYAHSDEFARALSQQGGE